MTRQGRQRAWVVAWCLVAAVFFGVVTLLWVDLEGARGVGEVDVCQGDGGEPDTRKYKGDGPHSIYDESGVVEPPDADYPDDWFVDHRRDAQLILCTVSEKRVGSVGDCDLGPVKVSEYEEVEVSVIAHEYDFAIRSLRDGRVVSKFSMTADRCPDFGTVAVDDPEPEIDADIAWGVLEDALRPLVTGPAKDRD